MSNHSSQALVAVSVCLAIFYYGGPTQLLQLGVLTCLLFGFGLKVFSALNRGVITWSKLHTGLLLYSLIIISNLFTSILVDNSRLVATLFLFLPIIVLMLDKQTGEAWVRLLKYLAMPIALSAVWGIAEFVTTAGRASGPVLDPNSWASSMNLAFFVFVSLMFAVERRWILPVFVLLTLLATASFMSYSRVGLVIFFAGLLFVVSISLTNSEWRKRAVALLLVCVTSFVAVQASRSSETATNNTEGYTLNAEAYGWTVRFAQWRSALEQYQDYPVFGSGLGTFKVLYPQYRSLEDHSTAGNYVHNDYLQVLAEAGPLVFLLVVALIAFLSFRMLLSVRMLLFDRDGDALRHLELVVLIVALGSVFVHALMNFSFYMLLNQLLMACVLTRVIYLTGLSYDVSLSAVRPMLAKVGCLMLVVYALLTNYADAISHDLVYRGGVLPLDRHDPEDQLKVFEILTTIRAFRSDSAANRFAMATFYRASFDDQPLVNEVGRRSLAIATALEYQSGLEVNPYAYDVRGYYADFLLQNTWLQDLAEIDQTPDQLYEQGLALTPLRLRPRVVLAVHLLQTERSDQAYEVLKGGLPYVGLKYDNYQYWRMELLKLLLREAKIRNDRETLEMLLSSI